MAARCWDLRCSYSVSPHGRQDVAPTIAETYALHITPRATHYTTNSQKNATQKPGQLLALKRKMKKNQLVLVMDFGGTNRELVARAIRSLGVYSEIIPASTPISEVKTLAPVGIILTGGDNSVYMPDSEKCDKALLKIGVPILGVGYGMQAMAHALGGTVSPQIVAESGIVTVRPQGNTKLLKGIQNPFSAMLRHKDCITKLPDGFTSSATTNNAIACFSSKDGLLHGTSFHLETDKTECGKSILENFLFEVCACKGDYSLEEYIEIQCEQIREQTKGERVLLGLSGGVDSSVVAALLAKAIPDKTVCIFVDHGFMRKDEGDQIEKIFSKRKLQFIRVNAEQRFLDKCKGVADPEQKRKIIGAEFVRVFEEESAKLGEIPFLAQGTIYPDIVESGFGVGKLVKTHHNVGGLPKDNKFKGLVEPLKWLFKDEVRAIGRMLGLPASLANRQPFPGPGLAVRVVGELTKEKLDTLREADAIVREILDKGKSPSQYFAIMTTTKSVGVKKGVRTFNNVVAVRAVITDDFMTCEYAQIPHKKLALISNRITSEVENVSRVVYDITSKPPGTIEWE